MPWLLSCTARFKGASRWVRPASRRTHTSHTHAHSQLRVQACTARIPPSHTHTEPIAAGGSGVHRTHTSPTHAHTDEVWGLVSLSLLTAFMGASAFTRSASTYGVRPDVKRRTRHDAISE